MIADCETCERAKVPCSGCEESQRTICFICQGDIADPYCELEGTPPMTATILPFPLRPADFPTPLDLPKPRTVTLLRLSGSLLATAGFFPGDPGAPWAWIQETVAAEYECHEEDVHVLETEGEGDLITAEGIPVCRVAL